MNLSKKSIYLFETIKIVDKKPLNLNYHIKRVALSINLPLKFDFKEILNCDLDGVIRAKVIYSEDGFLKNVSFHPYNIKKFYEFTLIDINFNYDKKYLNRDKIDNLVNKFGDIIMVKDGLITDTNIANIAIFDGKNWLTPKTPLLKGTFRENLLDKGFLKLKDISKNELLNAKKFAITNAMVGFLEIESFKFNLEFFNNKI